MGGSGLLGRLLLLFVASVVSLLAAEAPLRMSGRVSLPPVEIKPGRPEMYQEYPPYGYRLWPSRSITYDYPRKAPRTLTVHSNRHGFRGTREFDEPIPRPRIVVLGDSMVFGEGVEEPERFTDRLEASMPSWRVDNLGMTGFGPDLMLRAFEQVGANLSPKIVVLTIYTDDFRRVRPAYAGVGFRIPRYRLESGDLVSTEYPVYGLLSRSAVASALREAIWRGSGVEWALNAAILDRFRLLSARGRFRLFVVFLPGTSDTQTDRSRRSWLRAYCEQNGVEFVDATDALLVGESQTRFIPANWHLNAAGHEIVAREIAMALAGAHRN